jgi:hypothetical protein
MGVTNFYIHREVEDDMLIASIAEMELETKEWVHKRTQQTQTKDERLDLLGFK